MSGSICDALLAPSPGEITFEIARNHLAGSLVASAEVREAIRFAYHELKLVLEPGGAIGLAALLSGRHRAAGRTTAVVLSGGNIDPALFAEIVTEAPAPPVSGRGLGDCGTLRHGCGDAHGGSLGLQTFGVLRHAVPDPRRAPDLPAGVARRARVVVDRNRSRIVRADADPDRGHAGHGVRGRPGGRTSRDDRGGVRDGAGLGMFALNAAASAGLVIVLVVLMQIALQTIMPLTDAAAIAASGAHRIDYGRLRRWGSISFIAMTYVTGWAVTGRGPSAVIALAAGSVALVCVALWTIPAPPRNGGVRHRPTLASLKAVFGDRRVLLFVLAAGLVQGAHGVYYGFGTLNWRRLGYGEETIGALWATGVIAEIVLFSHGIRWVRRFGPVGLVALGGVGAALRWGLTALNPPLPVLFAVQLLHALTFGAVHLGAVHGIHKLVRSELAATVQTLYSVLSAGLFTSLATLLAGPLYARWGSGAYLAALAMGISGGFDRARLLSPQLRRGGNKRLPSIAQARHAVAREEKRAVEIDEVGALGEETGRRHGERGRDHATHHDARGPARARPGPAPAPR